MQSASRSIATVKEDFPAGNNGRNQKPEIRNQKSERERERPDKTITG
jgi:hypothetical protein